VKERGGGKKYRKIWGGKRRKKQRKTKTEKKVLVFFYHRFFFGFFDFFFLTKNLEGLEKNHQNFFLNFSSNPKIIMYRKKDDFFRFKLFF